MLGKTPKTANRDAVHVAIFPIQADCKLSPGDHVDIENGIALVAAKNKGVGIVDPFLTSDLVKGECFYLCLYPETVTGMTHNWNHPKFDKLEDYKKEMAAFAREHYLNYEEIMDACHSFSTGEYFCFSSEGGPELMYDSYERSKLFSLYYKITDVDIDPDNEFSFRCAC